MKIVLTNDDGYQAEELKSLRKALRNAGHNVTTVAPVSNQSWGGTTLQASANKTKLIQRGEQEYSLECADVIFRNGDPWPASTVQCYLVGEYLVPDMELLVSGMNIGQNTDGSPLFSGTCGAVFAGISRVIGQKSHPSIAFSLGEFANADRRYEGAQFAVQLINYLISNSKNGKLLPVGVGLNVNIPGGLPNGEQIKIVGVSLNRQGGVYNILGVGDDNYVITKREGDIFTAEDVYREPINDIPYSDNTALNEGYITIVPIVADATANFCSSKQVCKLLRNFLSSRSCSDDAFCKNLKALKYSVSDELIKANK